MLLTDYNLAVPIITEKAIVAEALNSVPVPGTAVTLAEILVLLGEVNTALATSTDPATAAAVDAVASSAYSDMNTALTGLITTLDAALLAI